MLCSLISVILQQCVHVPVVKTGFALSGVVTCLVIFLQVYTYSVDVVSVTIVTITMSVSFEHYY